MKKNRIKKIITISAVVLLLIATLGTFAAFFGKNDFAKVKDKWNDIKDKFQQEEVVQDNKNLISNSNFQINTTGITIFTEETALDSEKNTFVFMDGFVSDVGAAQGSDFELYAVENGLYVKNMSETANVSVSQYITDSSKIFGQDVTVSFSYNGVVYSKSFNFIEGEEYKLATDKLCYTLTYSQNGSVVFTLKLEKGFEGIINWVQLELGSVFTGYVAPVVA